MDNKAHIILSGVITYHGKQLITKNAFCKVYLSGYLTDYPDEKKLLIALKVMELPAQLLAYKDEELAETLLFDTIKDIVTTSVEKVEDIAWGVDAWADAIGISKAERVKIRSQCFPSVTTEVYNSQALVSDCPEIFTKELVAEVLPDSFVRNSRRGLKRKLVVSVAALFGLMMVQVSGSNSLPILPSVVNEQSEPVFIQSEKLVDKAEQVIKLEKLVVEPKQLIRSTEVAPKHLPESKLKIDQLRTDTEAFLMYQN